MQGFTITCNKCGNQVDYKEGLYMPKADIVLIATGLACNCGNGIEMDKEKVIEMKFLAAE